MIIMNLITIQCITISKTFEIQHMRCKNLQCNTPLMRLKDVACRGKLNIDCIVPGYWKRITGVARAASRQADKKITRAIYWHDNLFWTPCVSHVPLQYSIQFFLDIYCNYQFWKSMISLLSKFTHIFLNNILWWQKPHIKKRFLRFFCL